ncbi:MAG: hypothetical protein ACK6A9_09055 [Dolichospermum sp.]
MVLVERSHLLNSQTAIAPPQLPKQRTACSSATLRTHIPTKHLTKIDNICHN